MNVCEQAAMATVPATVQPATVTRGRTRETRPGEVDGALLWYLVRRYLSHYVAFRTKAQATLVTAWVLHAMARDRDGHGMGPLIWRASPRLLVTSKERGSGKSTLLDLIVILTQSRRGKIPKITPARIAQVIGKHHETVVLDEAGTIFGAGSRSLELQGILLAGYTRRTSYEISGHSYSLFGSVAYAGKDELITDTYRGGTIGDLLDRSLTIRLDPPARPKPEVAERAEDDGDLLARGMAVWTNGVRGELKQAARDIADEDLDAATEAARTPGGQARLRLSQITRPMRACARLVGPGAEDDLRAALDELTQGAAGAESAAIMAQLAERSARWGDDDLDDDDEPGHLVTTRTGPAGPAGGLDEDEDAGEAISGLAGMVATSGASQPTPPAAAIPAAPPRTYTAAWASRYPGQPPEVHGIPGPWPTLETARDACQATARTPLTWRPGERSPGTLVATVPAAAGQPEISYAIATAGR